MKYFRIDDKMVIGETQETRNDGCYCYFCPLIVVPRQLARGHEILLQAVDVVAKRGANPFRLTVQAMFWGAFSQGGGFSTLLPELALTKTLQNIMMVLKYICLTAFNDARDVADLQQNHVHVGIWTACSDSSGVLGYGWWRGVLMFYTRNC